VNRAVNRALTLVKIRLTRCLATRAFPSIGRRAPPGAHRCFLATRTLLRNSTNPKTGKDRALNTYDNSPAATAPNGDLRTKKGVSDAGKGGMVYGLILDLRRV